MKRQIEIFTAGCPVCKPLVELVKEMACGSCEVTVVDYSKDESPEQVAKIKTYGINRLPAIAVNGKLLDCCLDKGITEQLEAAGIGKPNN
jgi:glutaredoxin